MLIAGPTPRLIGIALIVTPGLLTTACTYTHSYGQEWQVYRCADEGELLAQIGTGRGQVVIRYEKNDYRLPLLPEPGVRVYSDGRVTLRMSPDTRQATLFIDEQIELSDCEQQQ